MGLRASTFWRKKRTRGAGGLPRVQRGIRRHTKKQEGLRLQAFSHALRRTTSSHQHRYYGAANAYSVVLRTLTGSDCWLHCRAVIASIQASASGNRGNRDPCCSAVFRAVPKIFFVRRVCEFSNDDIDTMRLRFTCIDTSTSPIARADVIAEHRLHSGYGRVRNTQRAVRDRIGGGGIEESSAAGTRPPGLHARGKPSAGHPDLVAEAFSTPVSHARRQLGRTRRDWTAPSCEDAHRVTTHVHRTSLSSPRACSSHVCGARYRAGFDRNRSMSAARHPTIRPPNAMAGGNVPSRMRL
ncbi:hypothetical protein NA66_103619 [Burkholderia pyrrocinia]|uniref:Uncharacterized protein n=1 Tax=Burkholderia pyrrocinia TaxID=60550 RepID=A0A318IEB7_BURPY|nr:hypothetical protein NA66_103619 [Burkholderia pyrrocinia]SFW88737.1 hypothetical protein SAMN03159384_06679 [Burkholderia sp. NFACC33-1]SFY46171.1 hypothetical protein SAMN03159408_06706 [Burkholderia sp. NFPP32]